MFAGFQDDPMQNQFNIYWILQSEAIIFSYLLLQTEKHSRYRYNTVEMRSVYRAYCFCVFLRRHR